VELDPSDVEVAELLGEPHALSPSNRTATAILFTRMCELPFEVLWRWCVPS
jgi:hypothetical protein